MLSIFTPKPRGHAANADDEIDGGKVDDGFAQLFQFLRRNGQARRLEQDDEYACNSKDSSRSSRADREKGSASAFADGLQPVDAGRQQVARSAGEDIGGQQTRGAQHWFGKQTQVPQAPHVGGQVDDAHVHEHGSDDAPPLAVNQHQTGMVGSEKHQLI